MSDAWDPVTDGPRNSWSGPSPATPFLTLEEAMRTLRFRPGMRTWHNDLKVRQIVEIAHATGAPINKPQNIFIRVVVEPGTSVDLPSEWDRIIHRLDPSGRMVAGGQAPQLRKEGQTYGVDPTVDPERILGTPQRISSKKRVAD